MNGTAAPRAHTSSRHHTNGSHRLSTSTPQPQRLRTPVMNESSNGGNADAIADEDPRITEFKSRYTQAIARLDQLFENEDTQTDDGARDGDVDATKAQAPVDEPLAAPVRPSVRVVHDDYGDDEDDDDGTPAPIESAVKHKDSGQRNGLLIHSSNNIFAVKPPLPDYRSSTASVHQPRTTTEDLRKKLQEEKQAAEDAAKRQFNTLYYTLENDKRAMLEQQKLDELDRQVENEMSGENGGNAQTNAAAQQGTLSSANLGATSLMLKHLLARIDSKRNMVHAQDSQLRRLISEVRKNRSKWASEEKVGQEELYEAAERVLQELKAMTENSGPFLQKVNKREAPDYYNVIKNPMDIGTMQKKLKALQYKSRADFVGDLYLIWNNCLRYNSDSAHPLRRKALFMQKHTDRLVVLIPDITIRDRAEVEAEERRAAQAFEQDADGADDSEDDMPIKASRGRKAPSKTSKKGTSNARKSISSAKEGTPSTDIKPAVNGIRQGSTIRADSDAPADQHGSVASPSGALTNGVHHGDDQDMDMTSNDLAAEPAEDPELDDFGYRLWKQTTKKARAQIAAERHRLFKANKLNGEEPALLRSKAGMRRFMRQQNQSQSQEAAVHGVTSSSQGDKNSSQALPGISLAEGMEEDGDDVYLPEHYDVVSGIPDISQRLRWEEDEDGEIILQSDETMRLVPEGIFQSPKSKFTKKIEDNMRQIQDTRRVCAKIGIVKQMQIQAQMYQNQFNKYDPSPFIEADVGAHVVTDDGPVMAPWLCRATFQRSIAKICYHTGFEDTQPSALDAITDIAAHFMHGLVDTIKTFAEAPKKPNSAGATAAGGDAYKPRFTFEQTILHSLTHHGVELEALESYAKDEVERVGTKLSVMHERMKSHLAELLRPALDPNTAGADGVGAFNDGSEQFVGGDFAGDIDEDFFGFKELGLDRELGLESLSVPFHLLQNRMHNAYQSQNANSSTISGALLPEPSQFESITIETLPREIGLIQDFFLSKLAANNNNALVEDDDLPAKQRFPKPRLPPTGKISSPRKRPLREQQQMAKKKRKLEQGLGIAGQGETNGMNGVNGAVKPILKPVGKLKLEMPPPQINGAGGLFEPEKDDEGTGMMSPESM